MIKRQTHTQNFRDTETLPNCKWETLSKTTMIET